ncbi:endonuclease III [Aureimonas sp. AU12]|uniref:endonuclease III n=1 Tax=Aureimonas sp. AU12 TaxID=1638161 RepID=UPI0009EB7E1E|nr:endonuclease III [Aureimonas sp. AU12]
MAEKAPAAKSVRRAKTAQPSLVAAETGSADAATKPAVAAKGPPARTRAAKAPATGTASSVAAATRRKTARRRPKIPYGPDEIAEIFRRFAVQRPEPQPELEHSSAFTLLVAVVLSAQATDAGVNRATRGLFARADTPQAMAALGEEAIREAIKSIGLYRNKAKNVAALAQRLVEETGGEVPRTREALEALPGVGRKTANVVLNTAFGEETLAVDTHIFRIGNRLKIAPGKTPEAVEEGFLRIIPAGFLRHAHHWLILHGRYVCKARKPDCEACIIADLCRADEKWCDQPAPLIALPVRPAGPQPLPPGLASSPSR